MSDRVASMFGAKFFSVFPYYLSRIVERNRLEGSEKDISRWGNHIVGPRKLCSKDVGHLGIRMDR